MFKPAMSTAQLRFRKPTAIAGAALLGLSLLLTAAPAFGAANQGNSSGTVKVHDASSSVETNGNDNEPHVCAFWLEFDFADSHEAGTWLIVSWQPTGNGSTVASGTYDTAGDGNDQSSVILLPTGHYRAEWAATGQSTTNKKTFWVDAGCDDVAPPTDGSPIEDPAPPADEPPADENVPPTDDPAPPADENVPPTDDPAEDAAPPSDESGAEVPAPADEQVLGGESDAEDPAPPSDETVTEDPAPPSDEAPAAPIDEGSAPEQAAQAEDPGSTDDGTPPDEGQLGGNGNTDGPTMTDTAVPTLPVQNGLLATVGLLLLILVHATARWERYADRD
jgi:hypothetical protein